MFCVIFVDVLVWRWFGVPLVPIYAPLFSIRVPLVPICVTLSTSSPLRTYFAFTHPTPFQDILYRVLNNPPPPPNTPAHFKPLYCYCYPPKIFIVLFPSFSIRVHFFSIRVHSCSFVFHSCSLVFIHVPFVFTRVHSCSICVPFVFTRVHSCSTRVHSCSTRVHSCSLVFHSCSFVFTRVHSCSDLCGVLDMILQ